MAAHDPSKISSSRLYASLGGLLALCALLSTSCGSPDPAPLDSPSYPCPYPNRFEGRWVAQVTEPNASGVYKLTFKPAEPAPGVHTVGTYNFVRDVTYGATPEDLAECRAMTFLGGSYVAKDGSLELSMSLGTEVREGCLDPANDNDAVPLSKPDEVYRAAVNGSYVLKGCILTINSLAFDNGIEPAPDDSAGD